MGPSAIEVAHYILAMQRECEELCAGHPQLKTMAYLISMARLEAAHICYPDKDLATLTTEIENDDARAKSRGLRKVRRAP
jgi:hypothetical protein